MKFRYLVASIALGLMLFGIAVAQEKSSSAPPKLVIASFTHDFGEVKAGTPLRYAFKVKNQGSANLLINSVSPG